MIAGNELLDLVDGEILEGVDAEVGEQFDDIRALEIDVRHVVRLIEQGGGLAPGALFVPPVGELGGDLGIDIGPDLRIAQQINRTADAL